MKLRIVLWIVLVILCCLFWQQLVLSFTTTYDEDWAHFFTAGFISVLTCILLVITWRSDKEKTGVKKLFSGFILVLASPLTLLGIFAYQQLFQMKTESVEMYSDGGISFSLEKRRNCLKAQNLLVMEKGDQKDSLLSIVDRHGALQKLYRYRDGRTIAIDTNFMHELTDKQSGFLRQY